jgi:hypothetical protein
MIAAVDVITHKNILLCIFITRNPKKFEEVVKLTVNIPANYKRRLENQNIPVLIQEFLNAKKDGNYGGLGNDGPLLDLADDTRKIQQVHY